MDSKKRYLNRDIGSCKIWNAKIPAAALAGVPEWPNGALAQQVIGAGFIRLRIIAKLKRRVRISLSAMRRMAPVTKSLIYPVA